MDDVTIGAGGVTVFDYLQPVLQGIRNFGYNRAGIGNQNPRSVAPFSSFP
jgi:hypothetical protein